MRDLLQFMYHGEVSVKREDLTSFIGTAEVLQIKGLTNKEVSYDFISNPFILPRDFSCLGYQTIWICFKYKHCITSVFNPKLPI